MQSTRNCETTCYISPNMSETTKKPAGGRAKEKAIRGGLSCNISLRWHYPNQVNGSRLAPPLSLAAPLLARIIIHRPRRFCNKNLRRIAAGRRVPEISRDFAPAVWGRGRPVTGLCPEMIRDFALEVWAACRPVTCRFEPAAECSGGFLLSCQKKAPRAPKEKSLFFGAGGKLTLAEQLPP